MGEMRAFIPCWTFLLFLVVLHSILAATTNIKPPPNQQSKQPKPASKPTSKPAISQSIKGSISTSKAALIANPSTSKATTAKQTTTVTVRSSSMSSKSTDKKPSSSKSSLNIEPDLLNMEIMFPNPYTREVMEMVQRSPNGLISPRDHKGSSKKAQVSSSTHGSGKVSGSTQHQTSRHQHHDRQNQSPNHSQNQPAGNRNKYGSKSTTNAASSNKYPTMKPTESPNSKSSARILMPTSVAQVLKELEKFGVY